MKSMAEDEEVDQIIDKCWQKIELDQLNSRVMPVYTDGNTEGGHDDVRSSQYLLKLYKRPEERNLWTTAHIFLSSTFRDMVAEREYIVKKVLPELADWAEKRGIRIVETDLRWGVPSHSTSMNTIETCLGELEHIKNVSNGQPLFLCLLGDRYGWVPYLTEITEEVAKRYNWIDGLSITHMEILMGAIRCRNRNALFCTRSPKFTAALSLEQSKNYCDTGILECKQLARLKKRIGAFLPDPRDQIYNYDASPKVSIEDSALIEPEFKADFGDKILKFFKASIERLYPNRTGFKAPDEIEEEHVQQLTYFERRCATTYGVEPWCEELTAYVIGSFTGENGSMALKEFEHTSLLCTSLNFPEEAEQDQNETWPNAVDDESGWTSQPICLISEPGRGKTSVLSQTAKTIMDSFGDIDVFIHFCSMTVSVNSISYSIFVRRFIDFLLEVLESPKNLNEVVDTEKLYNTEILHELLEELHHRQEKKVVIFLDSPENFSEISSAYQIRWSNFFPSRLPSNCTVVMTCTTNPDLWIHRFLFLADSSMIRMPEASVVMRKMIATKFFESYTKRLDNDQLTALINKDGANVPLWLKLACEELRVFGKYLEVGSKIRDFAGTLDGLLVQIINRIINENDELPIAKFLRFMAIAPLPMSEEDLPWLLGQPETDQRLVPMTMARLRLALKSYIMFGIGPRLLAIPFHSSFIKAAGLICTPSAADKITVKKELAMFMITYSSPHTKHIWAYSLIDLLWESDSRKELLHFLQYDQVGRNSLLAYKSDIFMKFRCPSYILGNLTVPFKVCQQCFYKMDFELNGRFVEFCWICKKRLILQDSTLKQATACPNHREYPLKVGENTCRICGVFRGPTYDQWQPLKLCQQCSRFNSCCHLSIEQSIAKFPLYSQQAEK